LANRAQLGARQVHIFITKLFVMERQPANFFVALGLTA